jgi:hypothetical protein
MDVGHSTLRQITNPENNIVRYSLKQINGFLITRDLENSVYKGFTR